MSNEWIFYFISRLDIFKSTGNSFVIVGGIGLITWAIITNLAETRYQETTEEFWKRWAEAKKIKQQHFAWIKRLFLTMLILGTLLSAIVPSTKEAVIILTGAKVMNYVQADTSLQKLPYETTKLIEEFLRKAREELKEQ